MLSIFFAPHEKLSRTLPALMISKCGTDKIGWPSRCVLNQSLFSPSSTSALWNWTSGQSRARLASFGFILLHALHSLAENSTISTWLASAPAMSARYAPMSGSGSIRSSAPARGTEDEVPPLRHATFSLYLPVPPYTVHHYTSLHLPIPPYTPLYLPIPPYTSLYLP